MYFSLHSVDMLITKKGIQVKIITNRKQESILDLTDYKSADFILPDNFDIGNFEKYIKFAAIKSSSNVARAGRKIGFTRLGVWLNEQKQQVIRYLKRELKEFKHQSNEYCWKYNFIEYKNDLYKLTERNKDNQLILKGKHLVYILEKYSYKEESQIDENAETLEDKLRDEHRPIPEEREDSNLFETLAEKFRPKYE